MYNIATIYKFKTPFINTQHEKAISEAIIEGIRRSLLYHDYLKSISIKNDNNYYYTNYELVANKGTINISYLSEQSDINFLPVFKLEFNIKGDKWEDKEFIKFAFRLFRVFDGLNKIEYLLEIDKIVYDDIKKISGNNLRGNCLNLIYKLEKRFESKNGEKIINKFIKSRKANPNLQLSSLEIYIEIYKYVLYLVYIYYQMLYFIIKSEDVQTQIKSLSIPETVNKDMFQQNFKLIDTRLDHLQDIGLINFKKYGQYINNFFKLFDQN